MRAIDRLIIKAKKIQNRVMVFFPIVVPDKAAADEVSSDLDEFCKDKPYYAVIIYDEDELIDETEGVVYHWQDVL